jgi:hypothetical protein
MGRVDSRRDSIHVEVVVNADNGDSGVDNDALAFDRLDAHLLKRNLLSNQGRDVGLEHARSQTHDDDAEDEDAEGRVWLVEDGGGSRSSEDHMADFGDDDSDENGVEAAEIRVGNPGTEEGRHVYPERVERGQREGDLLAHAQGAGLRVRVVGVEGHSGGCGALLGDEVGVDLHAAVVRHALNQLDKGDGVNAPWDWGGHALQREHLLLGGEAVALRGRVTEVAVLHGRLALVVEVRGRRVVALAQVGGVLALRVARVVDH